MNVLVDSRDFEGKCPFSPILSLITVVRNDIEGLKHTYGSLRHVDVTFEWIIVDGASTDGTVEWLRSRSLPRGVIVSEGDRGIYDAMNKGWHLSRGEWVYFLNAGDTLRRGVADLLRGGGDVDVVCARVALEDTMGRYLGRCHPGDGVSRDDFRSSNCIAHQGALLRRDLLKRFGGYSLAYSIQGDFEYWVRLSKGGAQFKFVNNVLAGFVYNGISSRRENYLRAEAERRAVLRHHGLLSSWQSMAAALRTALLFHAKSLALAVMPTGMQRCLRSGLKT